MSKRRVDCPLPGRHSAMTVAVASAAALVAASPAAVRAQDAVLEEVIVTAQKRAESLQDVPVAISAFDEGFIERAGVLDAKSIIDYSPSLAGNQKSSFTDTLTMRGIGSTNFGVGSESAIGIYKDNIYQGRAGASIASLFDVERIEVLRGPQSFLFGRHATAGAIHVITNKPTPERVEGYLTLGYGERDHFDAEGALNVPLGEQWAVRVSGALRREDGYITNVYPGSWDEVIDYDNAAVRAELARDGERFDALLSAEYEDRQDTATIYSALDADGRELTGDPRKIDSEFGDDHPDHGRITGVSLQLDYDVGFGTLTSITGYRGHDWSYGEDSDGFGLRILNYSQAQDGDYWSQEFRLVSTDDTRLKWYVGVSAYGEDIDASYGQAGDEDTLCGLFFVGDVTVGCEEAWPLVFGVPYPATPGILFEQGFVQGDYDGWAAYADVTYSVTDRFDVNLGLRYSKDNKEFQMYLPLADSPLAPVYFGYFTPEPIKDDKSWDDLSPRLTLTFRPNDDWTLYASATKGYKAGGFDMFTAVAPNGENFIGGPTPPGSVPNSFGPEEIWSYEAGVKATLFDNRAQLALTGFHYRYTDLQFASAEELGQITVRNVGQVDGDGLEFELRTRPVEPLEIHFSTAYIDTSVEDVPEATCGISSCDGNQLPYQSHWKASAGAAVTAPLGALELFGSADVQYQDSWFGEISNLPLTEEDDYTVLNLRGGLRSADQRWEAALYLDNATDEAWYDGRILLFTGPTAFGPSRPRTFGGTLTYRFGLE